MVIRGRESTQNVEETLRSDVHVQSSDFLRRRARQPSFVTGQESSRLSRFVSSPADLLHLSPNFQGGKKKQRSLYSSWTTLKYMDGEEVNQNPSSTSRGAALFRIKGKEEQTLSVGKERYLQDKSRTLFKVFVFVRAGAALKIFLYA